MVPPRGFLFLRLCGVYALKCEKLVCFCVELAFYCHYLTLNDAK